MKNFLYFSTIYFTSSHKEEQLLIMKQFKKIIDL